MLKCTCWHLNADPGMRRVEMPSYFRYLSTYLIVCRLKKRSPEYSATRFESSQFKEVKFNNDKNDRLRREGSRDQGRGVSWTPQTWFLSLKLSAYKG